MHVSKGGDFLKPATRILAAILVLLLLTGAVFCFVSADGEKTDEELIDEYQIPNTWARPALLFAIRNGLLSGKDTGLCPQDAITRAEVAAILVRVTGTSSEADLSCFSDVNETKWYYSEVSRAVAAGIFSGRGDGTFCPNDNITRQEAISVIANLIGLTGGAREDLLDFIDGSTVSDWARATMMPMVRAGYVKGSAGYLNPKQNISRQEFAQLVYGIFKGIGSEPGKNGNYAVRADHIAAGTTVNGDVILCSEAELISLSDIKITGRLVIQGCGSVALQLDGCNIDTLVLCRPAEVTGAGNTVSRITVLQQSRIGIDCTQIELHADTAFSGTAVSAAAVSGKLTYEGKGSVGALYSAADYQAAQNAQRVRIRGYTTKQTVLYKKYVEGGTFETPLRTLPKNTQFTYYQRYQICAFVRMPDGTEGYVHYSDIRISTDNYYASATISSGMEACFVNYINDYTSKTDYLIWINRKTLNVSIFEGSRRCWVPIKTFPCALGKNTSPTREGVRSVSKKVERCETPEYWYHHLTYFGGDFAMHSRLYKYDGTYYDSSMSTVASAGCVRLHDENAIWIYDNIPLHSAVVIF